ncbi:MAG: proton-conducting transporter membrane subunit [Anaerolineaceae bacterium]
MNLPLFWIIIPIIITVSTLLIRKKTLLYRSILTALTFLLGIGAFIVAAQSSNISVILTSSERFLVLGRSLNVTYTDLHLVGTIYLIACVWTISTFFYSQNEYFPAFCVTYTAFIIASISIDPFLYSVLILFLANVLLLPVLSSGSYKHITGRMRFLVFQLLSVFLILLAGWILAGGEIAPVEEDQLFISSVLLGCGIALWLGVFPFHTWIPLLAEEGSIFPFGFMLTMMPISGILMLLKFLNNFAWLREYSAFFPSLQYLGAVMILLGGVGAFFQKYGARIVAYVFISGIGMLLCSVGFIPLISTDLVSAWLIPFTIAFWSISVAYHELVDLKREATIESLKSGLFEKPLHSVLLISGLFSIIGLPFFSGFAPNILMLHTASESKRIILFSILGGEIFLVLTCIRLMLRLILHPEQKLVIPDKIKIDRILVVLVILLNIFMGIFPSVFFRPLFTTISKIFPLI